VVLGHGRAEGGFLRPATSDAKGEYLVGYAVSEPAGSPGGTANFDAPQPHPAGIGVTAELDGEDYVLNGRKYQNAATCWATWPRGSRCAGPSAGRRPTTRTHGELIGAMRKIQCTELLFDAVFKCMQVVGVNSVDRRHMFEKYLREATILPLYDAGNFGMQRRRVHGVIAHPDFNPRALMDDEAIDFTKEMETIDTVPGHEVAATPV